VPLSYFKFDFYLLFRHTVIVEDIVNRTAPRETMKLRTNLIFENAKATQDGVELNIYHKQRYNIELTKEEATKLRDQLSNALTCTLQDNGNRVWADPETGLTHRENGPAIITANGGHFYYHQGLPHRIGGPAQIYANGVRKYYQEGKLHRPVQDGPALIFPDGSNTYWVDGRHVLPPAPPVSLPTTSESEELTEPKKLRLFSLKEDSLIRKGMSALTDIIFWRRII